MIASKFSLNSFFLLGKSRWLCRSALDAEAFPLSCHPALDAGSIFMSFMAHCGRLSLWEPPLWAIVFYAHLRACSTPIAHGVGSYKNPSRACHPALDAGSITVLLVASRGVGLSSQKDRSKRWSGLKALKTLET
jgi:hypothetical protein